MAELPTGLQPDRRNANKGTVRGRALLEDSLRRYGAGRSILADKHGNIVAGNKTLEASADIGLPVRIVETDGTELVVVKRTDLDLDSDQGRSLAYADNRVAELDLSWDVEALLADRDAGLDLAAVGFDDDELAALLAGLDTGTEGLTDPDAVPGVPDEPITKPGDLWLLGRHRLLCGDSTNPQHIESLMDGDRAEMTITDPPYNVGIDYGDTTDDFSAAYRTFMHDWFVVCPSDGVVFTPGTVNLGLWYGIEAPKWVCVWRKTNQNSSSRLNGFNTWEPLLVYGKHPKPVGHDSWDIPIGMHDADIGHPVPKTAAAWSVFVEAFSTDGALLYDPFLGSGTTLIAAEQLGRTCYGMEISPAYCDVICRRWEEFTGQQAVRT